MLLMLWQWCQDLGAEPILAVWSGLYLDGYIVSQAGLQAYIQDTLDELEFLMGDASTQYGSLRASLGYPHPFTINYIEVIDAFL
jgi:alpha-L-arabinofuranosidase